MDDYTKYNEDEIIELSETNIWRGCLDIAYIKTNNKKETSYVLHATGQCDMTNGRRYIALPSGLNVNDPAVKAKYNLL